MPEISTVPGTYALPRPELTSVFELHEQHVIAQVQFGQAALKCRGSGICRVDLYVNDRTQWAMARCQRTIAKLASTEVGLVLMFDRRGLCERIREKYFSKCSIGLTEDLYLDAALCRKMKLGQVKIAPGRYPIVHQGARSFIVFDSIYLAGFCPVK